MTGIRRAARLVALLTLVAPASLAAQAARIDRVLQQYVDSGQIGGAVALVLRDGNVAYERAVGWMDRESRRPMTTDALFRIASQTKAITSAVILSLVEEGKVTVDDAVSRYIPAFAHTTVASRGDSGRVVRPAARQITIRDLLTHTAGISYGTGPLLAPLYAPAGLGPAAGWGWYFADKDEPICWTIERLATLPFVAQPGERWVYGYNTDILGCVAERASGSPLDELIRTRITGPLRMNDTYFFVPRAAAGRLVTVYASDSTNHARRAEHGPRGQGDYVAGPRKSFSGGAGLVSTAADYARFLQMVLDGGELDGVRVLAPNSVALMTHNQVGALYDTTGTRGFSFAFETTERAGTFRWGGAYGSTYSVDPVERLVIVFMMNQIPNRTDIATKLATLVYEALVVPAASH